MKKIRYIICVAMAAIMLLAAAGCQGGEAPVEPANTAEPTAEPAEATAAQSEYNAKAEAAYKAAVEKLVNDKVFPNGEDTGFADDSSSAIWVRTGMPLRMWTATVKMSL